MTIRSSTILASCAVVALSVAVAPPAHASSAKPEIGYFLSRTDVAVSVAMTLVSCPSEPGELPGIEVEWNVASSGSADIPNPVLVDVSSGFLAKRSNAFEFYPNGTLSGFNGKSEGQGGPFLASVLKTVAAIAPLAGAAGSVPESNTHAMAPPIPTRLVCQTGVLELLSSLKAAKGEIRRLENKVLLGTATSDDHESLERQRRKRAVSLVGLTIEAGAKFEDQGNHSPWVSEVTVPEILGSWFTPEPSNSEPGAFSFARSDITALSGYKVTILPEQLKPLEIKNCAVGPTPTSINYEKYSNKNATRSLYYRRPVLAAVVITEHGGEAPDCAKPLTLDAPLPIGQWGKVSSLPVGNAGLFGSREAIASFDPFGTPLKLSYGSDSGAADIGSTVEAAGGAVTAFADADTAALEREIKREELRQKLRELRATAAE